MTPMKPEMSTFRTNFMANLPGTLKDVQGRIKGGWELVAPQAHPRAELDAKVKPVVTRGAYESDFVPVKGADWEGEEYGFMLLRQKPVSSSSSGAAKASSKSNVPTMPAGFFTDVDQSFKGVRKFKAEDSVLISDDNSVIAGDFSDPPKGGTFKDLVDSYSSSAKSLTPITFSVGAGQNNVDSFGAAAEVEQEFTGDSKAHVVTVEANGTEYHYVAEPVVSALRSFPPATTVKAIIDTNTNPSEPALVVTDGSKFIAIGPITVEDASVVSSRKLGVLT